MAMLTYYVYDLIDRYVVARITGEDNDQCEGALAALGHRGYTDTDRYGATYSPAFGAVDGLIDTIDAEDLDASEVLADAE